jgi:DNA-binding PadR family transcriptional regulator
MTLNDALILSYIKRGINYGYSILAHVKESRSDEWVEFSRAGLYKTLDKLEKAGLINKILEQNGGRPPKKIYTISQKGKKDLEDFIENGFKFEYVSKSDLDAFLVAAAAASQDSSALTRNLKNRLSSVNGQLKVLNDEWPENKDSYPLIVFALYKRRLEMLESEKTWLEWFSGTLEKIPGDILHKSWGEVR